MDNWFETLSSLSALVTDSPPSEVFHQFPGGDVGLVLKFWNMKTFCRRVQTKTKIRCWRITIVEKDSDVAWKLSGRSQVMYSKVAQNSRCIKIKILPSLTNNFLISFCKSFIFCLFNISLHTSTDWDFFAKSLESFTIYKFLYNEFMD